MVRLVHPFPSILNGLTVAGLALIAGTPVGVSIELGASMAALQFGIGIGNDLVDEPADRLAGRDKPLVRADVAPRAARVALLACVVAGLALSAHARPWLPVVGVAGLGVGFAYDLWLKGTAWSWLPFAVGVPLVPVYAWLGATGGVPPAFGLLVPAAVASGTALALANQLADRDADDRSGVDSLAVRLGRTRTLALVGGLHAVVAGVALGSFVLFRPGSAIPLAVPAIVVPALAGLVGGVALGRSADAGRLQWAWETQAVATGLLAVGWVAALAGTKALTA